MKGQLALPSDRLLLRKRFLIGCAKLEACRPITDQLKNVS